MQGVHQEKEGDQGDSKEKEKESEDEKGDGSEKEEQKKGQGDQKQEQGKRPEDKQPQGNPKPQELSKQQIENLLQALQNEENKVQEKMNAKKVQGLFGIFPFLSFCFQNLECFLTQC